MNTENNILIAKFLEWEFNKIEFIAPENTFSRLSPFNFKSAKEQGRYFKSSIYKVNELLFHSSWDWLMPVVEKIESLIFDDDEYYNFNILGGCYVIVISSHGNDLITSDRGQSKLECTYNAVIEFIKWYNENAAKKE